MQGKEQITDLYAYSKEDLKQMIKEAVLIDRKKQKKIKTERWLKELVSDAICISIGLGVTMLILINFM